MCYNCGCGDPHDDMGHPDNITEETLKTLSSQWNISHEETKKKLLDMLSKNTSDEFMNAMFEKAAKAWGQSVDDAKKKTIDLLKQELS